MVLEMAASSRLVSLASLARNPAPKSARGRVPLVDRERERDEAASAEHGDALLGLGEVVRRHFHGPALATEGATTPGSSGGWWILAEVDVETSSGAILRPDLVGWRRDRLAERPRGRPVRATPDWVCDVRAAGSPEGGARLRAFERDGVAHYWCVDPERGTLTVRHWREGRYRVALHADRWQVFRAEPFDAIEIRAGSIFGDDGE